MTQTQNGKAFEWATGLSLSQKTGAKIVMDAPAQTALECYEAMTPQKKIQLLNSANVALDNILGKESAFVQSATAANPAEVIFNTDAAGKYGDVRDVMLRIGDKDLGISCKHNHEALKHSRLSDTINFVEKWGLDAQGCSQTYWDKIKPLFGALRQIRTESGKTALWANLLDKDARYYWPILDAWAEEVNRVCGQDGQNSAEACRAMIAYLVGVNDFYKVICEGKKKVHVQCFNFNNTLSEKRTKYPDYINSINSRNGGQYSKTITFNHGYSINFRIHSASSRVEPSLKFDITAISLPATEIYQQTLDV